MLAVPFDMVSFSGIGRKPCKHTSIFLLRRYFALQLLDWSVFYICAIFYVQLPNDPRWVQIARESDKVAISKVEYVISACKKGF